MRIVLRAEKQPEPVSYRTGTVEWPWSVLPKALNACFTFAKHVRNEEDLILRVVQINREVFEEIEPD